MNKKKLYGTLIAVIAFAILVVGATFAWLTYTFNATNGTYNTATVCFDTISSEGQDIDTTLDYVTKPIDGVNTSISMGLQSDCNISADGVISINILSTTSSILYSTVADHCENPDTLATIYGYDNVADCSSNNGAWIVGGTALKYAIYDTNSPNNATIPLTTGYITKTGDNALYDVTLPVGTIDTYYIYFWLDGELINEDYQDASFSGYIHTQANQDINNINPPEVVDGLIPVKISKTGETVTTVSENDATWYDYYNKKWANAVLVNESTHTREYYKNNPSTVVPQEDILAYYVWIPRYSYKVWRLSGESSNSENHSIEIKFIPTSVIDKIPTKIDKYYTHPAFWWDNDSDGVREEGEELSGIWVGKFEISHTSNVSETAGVNNLGCTATSCDSTKYDNLRILPNVRSLNGNSVAGFFFVSRAMETNGNVFGINPSNADSHMIKNSEWGAVAYLSRSKYGINEEIRTNNTINSNTNGSTSPCVTGCGAIIVNNGQTTTCDIKYGTTANYPQSTTGNVTGVFDMSGGAHEYVMGVYNNINNYSNSYTFNSSTNPLPDTKYYNNYLVTALGSCTLETCGGHALSETKSWYGDGVALFNSSNQWLLRGGIASSAATTGIFAINRYNGSGINGYSSRFVLIKESNS